MVDIGKEKYLYLYLDNETMTGYVGETKDPKTRHSKHKYDTWPGRNDLINKIKDPPIIKADFKNMTAVQFAEHAVYEKYKDLGYDMLQKPPHPNIFKKYYDRIDDCKICGELGCDFTKERLEYILAVHHISKLCPICNKPFYYDPIRYQNKNKFNKKIYCSSYCSRISRIGSYNISKLCPVCNKAFSFDKEKHQNIVAFKKQVYCSYSCLNKSKGSRNVSKLCPGCNKPFYFDRKKHYNSRFKKQIYCSHNCYLNSKSSKSYNVSKLCPVCNKSFYFDLKKYGSLSRFQERIYCSRSCSDRRGKVYSNE
jgi:hypothetical protein